LKRRETIAGSCGGLALLTGLPALAQNHQDDRALSGLNFGTYYDRSPIMRMMPPNIGPIR
jgi:hypothetical protein